MLGYLLSKRGHICINGAGTFGCMAAMNDGVELGDGHVRGVIHEMFLVDQGYVDKDENDPTIRKQQMRRGSSHSVFDNAVVLDREEQNQQQQPPKVKGSTNSQKNDDAKPPIREILVAGGPDLQERKKFLVAGTDALIVLPGGPGTWDELWEMACSRHLKLNVLPIVCVNVDGYYEPFREMLQRAWKDGLIHLPPEEIVQFAPSAEDAIRFVEGKEMLSAPKPKIDSELYGSWQTLALTFVCGTVLGMAVTRSRGGQR